MRCCGRDTRRRRTAIYPTITRYLQVPRPILRPFHFVTFRFRRFNSHTFIYAFDARQVTFLLHEEYLEKEALKDWAEATKGVDGAETVEVVLVIALDFIASVSC